MNGRHVAIGYANQSAANETEAALAVGVQVSSVDSSCFYVKIYSEITRSFLFLFMRIPIVPPCSSKARARDTVFRKKLKNILLYSKNQK
jgi:hypothetical protein